MHQVAAAVPGAEDYIAVRRTELFQEQQQNIIEHTDWIFVRLLTLEWLAGILIAFCISPQTWSGAVSSIHPHVWAALLLGGAITIGPVLLALTQPGKVLTRHAIGVGQMLMSALLIHLTGGRIETHFHVFGSLAILAFYRDWKVLMSATAVVYIDHLLRGIFWPQSVYGVLAAPVWRSLEHAGWVIFEVAFLLISVRKSLSEMSNVAERQARLEALNANIERVVAERTAELTRENSERRQAEERLQQSQAQLVQSQKMEAVGRLAGGVAHDFNNLLTVVTGYSDFLLLRLDEKSPLRREVEEIQRAAERAAGLTRQLLAFSRKQVLQPRILNLNDIVGDMNKMLQRLIGEDIELRAMLDPNLGKVSADQGQIEQVILNLVVNSRDAMPHGGKLTIETANVFLDHRTVFRNRGLEIGDYVMLAVTDTGVGMTDEVKAHLFEPFFSTKGVGKGTGLGLATCYGIVCQSEGDIRVYTEPGSGTTFKIYLPRAIRKVTEATVPKRSNEMPRGTESVLMVEDDPSVRKLATTVLARCGYRIEEAVNALEALALIDRHPPFDLVITDVVMPQMSGKQLYLEIMKRVPEVRVLFISGYTDDALAHHGVLDEGLSFLEKPFSPARLAQKVREVLDTGRKASPAP
jgi:signal transduction histidine kinase/ActR/RegA family two-component response regulator